MSEAKMISIALSQVGSGGSKYESWYGVYGSWCDIFQSWLADQAGELSAIGGKHAYCPDHVTWFRNHGQWGHTPRKGAIVFFDWNGNGLADHVGIVVAVRANGSIETVEGNSGSPGRVRHVVRSSYILGYGYPKYSGGSSSGGWNGRILRLTRPYMSGSDVKDVQNKLNKKGYKLSTDGVYGPKTYAAVRSFQKKSGLVVDGQVGSKTYGKLSK